MGRTPVVKELGPGGGVETMERSCEVPGLPGGVWGSIPWGEEQALPGLRSLSTRRIGFRLGDLLI